MYLQQRSGVAVPPRASALSAQAGHQGVLPPRGGSPTRRHYGAVSALQVQVRSQPTGCSQLDGPGDSQRIQVEVG